jgi:hypothetical protein
MTVFMFPNVSDIQRQVKKEKQVNEHVFAYSPTQASHEERAIPPPLGKTGASWRVFGDPGYL